MGVRVLSLVFLPSFSIQMASEHSAVAAVVYVADFYDFARDWAVDWCADVFFGVCDFLSDGYDVANRDNGFVCCPGVLVS